MIKKIEADERQPCRNLPNCLPRHWSGRKRPADQPGSAIRHLLSAPQASVKHCRASGAGDDTAKQDLRAPTGLHRGQRCQRRAHLSGGGLVAHTIEDEDRLLIEDGRLGCFVFFARDPGQKFQDHPEAVSMPDLPA